MQGVDRLNLFYKIPNEWHVWVGKISGFRLQTIDDRYSTGILYLWSCYVWKLLGSVINTFLDCHWESCWRVGGRCPGPWRSFRGQRKWACPCSWLQAGTHLGETWAVHPWEVDLPHPDAQTTVEQQGRRLDNGRQPGCPRHLWCQGVGPGTFPASHLWLQDGFQTEKGRSWYGRHCLHGR